ncbi:ATP-dependent helicase/DNAse subunit B [Elusimicrobium simillimum]|uniref:PD-(D/E)XK nuclease family protein n=1 Tax=Elusimicrobium simillimum TaxID=3143438 RepID=UPI003C6FC218
MKLIHGSYQSLENYFCAYIKEIKTSPLDKVLVVTPSGRLSRYLAAALTTRMGATSNISLIKFSNIAARVDKEFNPAAPPLLASNALQDFILKNIADPHAKRGYVTSLKSTLRDLADGLVDAATVKEHAAEGAFGAKEDNDYMAGLMDTLSKYKTALSSVPGMRSYYDYFDGVLENIPQSAYLAGFKKIVFYGFYDFTGIQLEIFNTIRQHYDCALFFPYQKTPAYNFVSKFFESNILGMASEVVAADGGVQTALGRAADSLFNPLVNFEGKTGGVSVVSASGPRGELYGAAKTILGLVETHGYKFADIAVAARTDAEYKNDIFNIFEQNKIPLNMSAATPLLSHPLAVFCFNLLNLSANGFDRRDVGAVVSSPYFLLKNNWKFVVRNSLAERGLNQWTTLLDIKESEANSSFVAWLNNIDNSLKMLDKPYPWDILADHALTILRSYTDVDFTEHEKSVFAAVEDALNQIKQYSLITPAAKEGEFLEELQNILAGLTINKVEAAEMGVTFGDALGLRGQSFRAVILLGVNEKVFPQIVREDPMLRDKYRRTLRDVQGYWVGQKLDRFDEERLLFNFLVTAAREKLFLFFERSDEGGKALAPSLYLSELCRAANIDMEAVLTNISRRELEKYFETAQPLLNKKEVSVKISSLPGAQESYTGAGFDYNSFAAQFTAAQRIGSYGDIGPHDGVVDMSEGKEIMDRVNNGGFSASSLQILAQCPMRFFLTRGVGLEDEVETLKRDELASNLKGIIYHKILQRLYSELRPPYTAPMLLSKLEEIISTELAFERYKEFGMYPVVWRVITAKMRGYLEDFVQKDLAAMEGFAPTVFELPAVMSATFDDYTIKLRGYIDRADTRGGEYRIIDYKTSQSSVKDLTKVVFAKKYLQPMVYPLLAESSGQFSGKTFESFSFLNIEKGYFQRTLSADGRDMIKNKFENFMSVILSFIKFGKFFLNDSELHCPYCSFAGVCRKGGAYTLIRARGSDYFKELESFKND